jgi:hypothetical protein
VTDPIKFPGEYFTQEDRDRDRWSTVASLRVLLPRFQREQSEEWKSWIRIALTKFADVSVEGDIYTPEVAVKMLLETLIDDSESAKQASKMAMGSIFDILESVSGKSLDLIYPGDPRYPK